jgi:hypothetical protein
MRVAGSPERQTPVTKVEPSRAHTEYFSIRTMSKEEGTEGGFLSRWSRRKAQVRVQHGDPAAPSAVAGSATAATASVTATPATSALPADALAVTRPAASTPTTSRMPAQGATAPTEATAERAGAAAPSTSTAPVPQAPRPTLSDVENLDASSDYRAFVARDVDPQVRNAAFKKMFHSDPHFNVMDGLDVYIDDYNTPNPLPVAVMKTLVQARALGLIDDELKEQDLPAPDPLPPAMVAEEPVADAEPVSSDAEHPETEAGGRETAILDAEPAIQLSEPGSTAEVVHVLHVEPVYAAVCADAAPPLVSGPALASSPSTAPGTVVPFPRRPGSADPT